MADPSTKISPPNIVSPKLRPPADSKTIKASSAAGLAEIKSPGWASRPLVTRGSSLLAELALCTSHLGACCTLKSSVALHSHSLWYQSSSPSSQRWQRVDMSYPQLLARPRPSRPTHRPQDAGHAPRVSLASSGVPRPGDMIKVEPPTLEIGVPHLRPSDPLQPVLLGLYEQRLHKGRAEVSDDQPLAPVANESERLLPPPSHPGER